MKKQKTEKGKRTEQTGKSWLLFCCSLFLTALFSFSVQAAGQELKLLFTHDMHDYYYGTETVEDGQRLEHGGAARLATILKENSDEATLYLDCGDFSMGTLYQAAFSTDAYELRNLGLLGCRVTTFGNHEFDYGAGGMAEMLRAALASGDPLPEIVLSNIDFSGNLNEEQQELKAAFEDYGIREYTVLSCNGIRIGIFGLEGRDSIECIQADIPFTDYITQAKSTVEKLKAENCELILALSHSGTEKTGGSGEDFDLAREVPDIDIIVSGHTHTCLSQPVRVGKTLIVSCWEYLKDVGKLSVARQEDGSWEVTGYELIPVNSAVKEDPETAARLQTYQKEIERTYLADKGGSFDKVIAHSSYDMISLSEMFATHQEYTTGDLIADAYLYEAERNGISDIDVALVGLGTIRGSVKEGNITVADAFEICSLGVGEDGSAGHPLVTAWITGKELKLLTELDASLGPLVNSIKMSYSGLEFSFNESRPLLDRVTEVHLKRKDQSVEEIRDEQLYKVVANMYAVNMLGMLNGLTKGVLSITPKKEDGTPVGDFYEASLRNADGTEIKEWVAFKNYLESFPTGAYGVPELPERYRSAQGRKTKYTETGIAAIRISGVATKVMPMLLTGLLVLLILLTVGNIKLAQVIKRRRGKKSK